MKIETILTKNLYLLFVLVISLLFFLVSDDVKELLPGSNLSSPTPVASPSATVESVHGGVLTTVVDVIDGDTIKIEGGEIVRYIGMNTPETVDPRRPVECFGKEASVKNEELVQGKVVELEKDISERDVYGRLLRYIWVGDTLINEQLVREGYARVSTYPPDVKYEDVLLESERFARGNEKGLWSSCPLPTPTRRPQQKDATSSATPSVVL